jgi:hypothetical protein
MWYPTKSLNDIPADITASYKRLVWITIGVLLSEIVMK